MPHHSTGRNALGHACRPGGPPVLQPSLYRPRRLVQPERDVWQAHGPRVAPESAIQKKGERVQRACATGQWRSAYTGHDDWQQSQAAGKTERRAIIENALCLRRLAAGSGRKAARRSWRVTHKALAWAVVRSRDPRLARLRASRRMVRTKDNTVEGQESRSVCTRHKRGGKPGRCADIAHPGDAVWGGRARIVPCRRLGARWVVASPHA